MVVVVELNNTTRHVRGPDSGERHAPQFDARTARPRKARGRAAAQKQSVSLEPRDLVWNHTLHGRSGRVGREGQDAPPEDNTLPDTVQALPPRTDSAKAMPEFSPENPSGIGPRDNHGGPESL